MSAPARQGKPWSEEEIQMLLQAVKRKETKQQIAAAHQRSVGGIHSRLRSLAADYYFNDNRPMDEIMKFTGLDLETITDAIAKRQWQMDNKEKPKPVQKFEPQVIESKKEGMVSLLTEIRDLMKEMVELMKKD